MHIAKIAWTQCLNRWGMKNHDLSINMMMVAPMGHDIAKSFKHNPGRRDAHNTWFELCTKLPYEI